MEINDKGDTLVHFSALGNADMPHQSCHLHVTTAQSQAICAVLLEHGLCAGGVFVLAWHRLWRRRWDVCSAWHSPGPDFTAPYSEIDVIVELNEVIDGRHFTIQFMAVEIPHGSTPDLRYLSATEGQFCVLAAPPHLPSSRLPSLSSL